MFAYIFIALGAATLVATGVAGCEHKGKLEAQREVVAKEAIISQMIATAKFNLEEAEKREDNWKQANEAIKKRGKRDTAALNAELQRIRGQPSRPDGSAIQTPTCPGSGTDGVSEKFVSLAEYESLQARAAADAQDWVRLQDYVTSVCLGGSATSSTPVYLSAVEDSPGP